jgi:hypothetical protein
MLYEIDMHDEEWMGRWLKVVQAGITLPGPRYKDAQALVRDIPVLRYPDITHGLT